MSEFTDFLSNLKTTKINNIKLLDSVLSIMLEDGTLVNIEDTEQQCCEHRFMTTDDVLTYFNGANLMDVEISGIGYGVDEDEDEWYNDAHDIQFLTVKTSLGVFTVDSHNIHNGYYGGFDILISVLTPTTSGTNDEYFRRNEDREFVASDVPHWYWD